MFRLRVFGGFAVEGPAGAVTPQLPQRRAAAVLAVLAACGDLGCTRERLIALLWSESDEAHARHNLRDALHAIRQVLGPDAVDSAGDRLQLHRAVIDSDIHDFTQALAADRATEAVRAYGGPLLDGFHVDDAPEFERWLDGERSRLARECVEALVALAERSEASGAWKDAAGWWARAVEQDPLNSHFVLQQVRALAALGDRANAIKLADAHGRRLRSELDLEPDREVLAKIERIRRGELLTPADRRAMTGAEAVAGTPTAAQGNAAAGPDARRGRTPARGIGWLRWAPLAALVALACAIVAGHWLRPTAVSRYPRTAIAVLPFQNLSADSAHAFFAAGLHDELLTQLAKVAALKVIGRTSVIGYQGTSKPLRQIGEELGVGSIVEGSVQIVGDRLRVTVQLLDPVTQTHLWAENYDRTVADAFAVESDIAQRVVAEVGAVLTEAEATAIAAPPTQNAEAYQLYLQGLDYWRRPAECDNREIAQRFYERALSLDSTFAQAHAALSDVHGAMYIGMCDHSPERAELQRREAEAAVRLAPSLPEALYALGLTDLGRQDFAAGLEEFRNALRRAPNHAEGWYWKGLAHRSLGEWDSALVSLQYSVQLDPRNSTPVFDLGMTLEMMRRYSDAIAAFRRAIAIAPDFLDGHVEIGWSYFKWQGRLDTLRAVVGHLPVQLYPEHVLMLAVMTRESPDSILALVRSVGREALRRWSFVEPELQAARAHFQKGDTAAAHAAYWLALARLDSLERARPQDWEVHGNRGTTLAYLGRRAEALQEARWIERSPVYRNDHYWGPWAAFHRALILAELGDRDGALAELDRFLARPGHTSVYEIRMAPWFDRIRHDPRFQALLVKYANTGAP